MKFVRAKTFVTVSFILAEESSANGELHHPNLHLLEQAAYATPQVGKPCLVGETIRTADPTILFAPKRTKIKIAPSPQVIQESADHLPQTVVQVVFDMEHEIAQVLSNNDPVSFLSFRVSIFFDAPRMSRAS